MASSHFEKNSVMMMVREVTSFDVNLIDEVMMTDFAFPDLLNMWVVKFPVELFGKLVRNMIEVIVGVNVHLNFNVAHKICFLR